MFVGVDAGSVFFATFIGSDSGRLHAIFLEQSVDVPDIHRAPDAAGLARRETNFVTLFIDALAEAVDPAKAERFVNGFGPGNARFARVLFVETNPEFF